ncbi:MAG: hypothetical protein ACTSYA_10005 [Candidatus Kariarchaeaceae archaeon]
MKFIRRWRKNKRAVSPILATLFITGIFVSSITLALTYVVPQIIRFNEERDLGLASISLTSTNQEIRQLLVSPVGSRTSVTYSLSSATLVADGYSITGFTLKKSNVAIGAFPYSFPRLVIELTTDQNIMPKSAHEYLTGTNDQDYFCIDSANTVSQPILPLEILNISRDIRSEYTVSLGYRWYINAYSTGSDATLVHHIIVSHIHMNFTTLFETSKTKVDLNLYYESIDETTYEWLGIASTDNITLEAETDITGALPFSELAYIFDGPPSPFTYGVELTFMTFNIVVTADI